MVDCITPQHPPYDLDQSTLNLRIHYFKHNRYSIKLQFAKFQNRTNNNFSTLKFFCIHAFIRAIHPKKPTACAPRIALLLLHAVVQQSIAVAKRGVLTHQASPPT